MRPDRAHSLLQLLLRVGGTLTGFAIFAVFLPTDRMASIHAILGLGSFPASTLVDYLTRSVAGMYAFHGAVLWIVSFDPRRYAPVIAVLGAGNIVFGLLLIGIDVHAGLPGWWIAGEGPWVALAGVVLLALLAAARPCWRAPTATDEQMDMAESIRPQRAE
jgi:hypothetical protein